MLQLIVQQLGYLRIHVESCPGVVSKIHINPSDICANVEQIYRKFTISSIDILTIITMWIELIISGLFPIKVNYKKFEFLESEWKGFFKIINRTR